MFSGQMNRERTISVYRYALAVASCEDDPLYRQLGPIHLIKYAYLVDLEYARHHGGETFTSIDWTFYNFGPWSTAAHGIITAAMATSGISERRIPSDYGRDDLLRWSVVTVHNESCGFGADLPIEVRGTLDSYVHQFGADTSRLLHHVYATAPMLHAAPGDSLDFKSASPQPEGEETFVPLMSRLSKRQKNSFRERMEKLSAQFEECVSHSPRARERVSRGVDSDFAETAAWVNSLAGPEFPDGNVTVEFNDSVWRSEARQGHAAE